MKSNEAAAKETEAEQRGEEVVGGERNFPTVRIPYEGWKQERVKNWSDPVCEPFRFNLLPPPCTAGVKHLLVLFQIL